MAFHLGKLFATLIFIMGLAFFGASVVQMLQDTDIARNGIRTIGYVTDLSTYRDSRGDYDQYRVHFTFQDQNGTPYAGEDTISEQAYESYGIGQSIDVFYYPNDPNASLVDIDDKIATNRFGLLASGIMAVVALIVFVWIEYEAKYFGDESAKMINPSS